MKTHSEETPGAECALCTETGRPAVQSFGTWVHLAHLNRSIVVRRWSRA